MPPAPIWAAISYTPRRVPGVRATRETGVIIRGCPGASRSVAKNGVVPNRCREDLSSVVDYSGSLAAECTCEQSDGTSARYACSKERDHECKPSPYRHTSASTSGEKAEQAARADCGGTGDRTDYIRSKTAANLLTISHDDERAAAANGRLVRPMRSVRFGGRSRPYGEAASVVSESAGGMRASCGR